MKGLVLMVLIMSLLNDSAKAQYHQQGRVQHHYNSEVNKGFGIADPIEFPSESYHETHEPTYRAPAPPGYAFNSDGYIIPTSQVVTNSHQRYGARSIAPVPIYETNNRPTGNPNYAMNSPPAGNPHFPMNSPPAGNPHFPMNRPPMGNQHFPMNSPPMGNPHIPMNSPPVGNPHFPMNSPPVGNPHFPMNSLPVGNPHFPMIRPLVGNPNFPMIRHSAGRPNNEINIPQAGNPNFIMNPPLADNPNGMNSPPGALPNNGINNPNYAMNNRLAYANRGNVANMRPFQVGGNPYYGRAPSGYMSHRAPNNVRNNRPPQMNPSFAARIPYYGAGNPRNYGADNGGLSPANYNISPNISGRNPIPFGAMMPQKPPGYSANNPFKYGDRLRGSSFIPSPPVVKRPTPIWG